MQDDSQQPGGAGQGGSPGAGPHQPHAQQPGYGPGSYGHGPHQPGYGPQPGYYAPRHPGADKKIICGLFAILLPGLGIHKFILGYNTEGVVMLVIAVAGLFITCGIATTVVGVISIIEGVLYLTKSDEEFVQIYIHGYRGWF